MPLHDFAYPKDAQKNIAKPDKEVRLTRIHLEEDVAKSFHFETSSGIDFNRAGTPLMEIVSEPEINTPEEAFAYLTALQQILIYGGVSDADMEKGQLRCDCNVSVRPEGQEELGVKIEIKNMNSISGVRRALAYEIERQTAPERGEKLVQRRAAGTTTPARRSTCARKNRARLPLFSRSRSAAGEDRGAARGSAGAPSGAPGAKRARFVADYQVTRTTPASWRARRSSPDTSTPPRKARRNRRTSQTGS